MTKSPKASLKPRSDDPEQSKAFIEKAREIGADEKRSAADKLMERLAKTPPRPKEGSHGKRQRPNVSETGMTSP
jgi:hypothetical protein